MPLTDEQRELLEAEYLRRLMKTDAKVWRERFLDLAGLDDEDTRLPVEFAKMIGAMKRVRTPQRVEVKIQRDHHQLWRVTMPNGFITDITNRSRARDAARTLALSELNRAVRYER